MNIVWPINRFSPTERVAHGGAARFIGNTADEFDEKPGLTASENKIANSTMEKNMQQELIKYGELVILGYNGHLTRRDRGRKRSKFVLMQRPSANGTKPTRSTKYSSCHSLAEPSNVLVEYEHDENTDMFQVGRSADPSVDLVIVDAAFERREISEPRNTVSKFACRIVVERRKPAVARIFASGFSASRSMILGKRALKWRREDGGIDGLTTNGVLIAHRQTNEEDSLYGYWREVSVNGDIYSLRNDRTSKDKGKLIDYEDNVLRDWTLINLCGATLLWRSAEGLARSPDKYDLESFVANINANGLPRKLGGATRLPIPSGPSKARIQPCVFPGCGHVHWLQESERSQKLKCPTCLTPDSVTSLCMGMEPAFYVDHGLPNYAFNPCGHIATQKTIEYWSRTEIPHGINGFIAVCPFCATPLEDWPGYVKLLFPFGL